MNEKNDLNQVFQVKTPPYYDIHHIVKRQNIKWTELRCKVLGCKGKPLITDDARGEIICGCCGSIVTEKSIDINPNRTNDVYEFLTKTRNGPGQSLSMYDRGMMTMISNKDALGKPISGSMKNSFIRLKILDTRNRSRSYSRTLRSALLFLDVLESKLGLPDFVVENAAYIYRKAMQKKITIGRNSKRLMCASVYAACRQNGVPRSIIDISQAASIRKKEVSKSYRKLIEGLGLRLSCCPSFDYVTKISNEINMSRKTSRYALNVLKKLTESELTDGKNPMVLVGAALYLSCVLNKEHITQEKIAKACGVTSSAIRIRYHILRRYAI